MMNQKKSRKRDRRAHKSNKKLLFWIVIFSLICIVIASGSFLLTKNIKENLQEELAKEMETIDEDELWEENKKQPPEHVEELKIHFIDVGQGDGALIQCGDETAMIDVGSLTAGKNNIVPYLEAEGVTVLDYLFMSHGHEDHTGAAYDLIWKSDVEIKNAVYDFGNPDDGNSSMVNNSLMEKEVPIIKPEKETVYQVGDAEIKILLGRDDLEMLQKEPEEGADETMKNQLEITNVNNQSIAILITHGENTFLFYGDGEKEYEDLLLKTYPDLKDITVLKAPHHGGGDSCQEETLRQLTPQNVVISSESPDTFGFPTEEVVGRLEENKINIYETYKHGTIIAISDGEKVTFQEEKE